MAGWKVWGELRRRTHIELVWALMRQRGRIEDIGDGRRRITIDARLDQCNRRASLAHELVHDERGILFTDDTPVLLIVKEEAYVRAETTRRLVPLDELDLLVRAAVLDDRSVTWREVAEWFDVPRDTALDAMDQLKRRARTRHPAEYAKGAGSNALPGTAIGVADETNISRADRDVLGSCSADEVVGDD